MNSGDISDGAKLGLCAMILCSIIFIFFNMFTMIRGFATAGSNQLTNQVNQLKTSVYAQYDQQTVYGSSVVTAINTYSADKFTVVVNNTPINSATKQSDFDAPKLPDQSGEKNLKPYYYGYQCDKGEWDPVQGFFTSSIDPAGTKSGSLAPTRATGQDGTFINESLRYDSYLIKDTTGTIIGVYFQLHLD